MKYIAAILFAIGVGSASLSAWAQGAYIGAGFGQTSVDYGACEGDIACTVDDTDNGYKIFGGYQFGRHIAAEIAYVDLGAATESGSDSSLGTYSGTFELSGLNFAAVGLIPISKRFGLQGKAGMFRWDLDANVTSSSQGSLSVSDDGFEPMFGIGGVFNLTERIGFLVEYEKYLNVGDGDVFGEGSDVDLLSASVVFRF